MAQTKDVAYGYEHIMASNTNMDGEAVSGTKSFNTNYKMIVYSACSAGGKFTFDYDETIGSRTVQRPVKVSQILLSMPGTQATWTISKVDIVNGNAYVLFSGTTDTSFFYDGGADGIEFVPGEFLKIVTTGTITGTVKAKISVDRSTNIPTIDNE